MYEIPEPRTGQAANRSGSEFLEGTLKKANLIYSVWTEHPMGGGPMKNFFRGIVFAVVALALGGWLYLRFGFAEVCANIPVSRLDSELANAAVRASAASQAHILVTSIGMMANATSIA
jgi:hypothetical protein